MHIDQEIWEVRVEILLRSEVYIAVGVARSVGRVVRQLSPKKIFFAQKILIYWGN
jgi:hypothetical protein